MFHYEYVTKKKLNLIAPNSLKSSMRYRIWLKTSSPSVINLSEAVPET